ncbi:hypothetical protein B0H10DRAFT_1941048 [Mycena sp. CBHHK59/15]|nr:hypothetical protein B0H10DRAFT_1941048 [Mycena sp. CBHHK59/15]
MTQGSRLVERLNADLTPLTKEDVLEQYEDGNSGLRGSNRLDNFYDHSANFIHRTKKNKKPGGPELIGQQQHPNKWWHLSRTASDWLAKGLQIQSHEAPGLVAFEGDDAGANQKRQRKIAVSVATSATNSDLAREIAATLNELPLRWRSRVVSSFANKSTGVEGWDGPLVAIPPFQIAVRTVRYIGLQTVICFYSYPTLLRLSWDHPPRFCFIHTPRIPDDRPINSVYQPRTPYCDSGVDMIAESDIVTARSYAVAACSTSPTMNTDPLQWGSGLLKESVTTSSLAVDEPERFQIQFVTAELARQHARQTPKEHSTAKSGIFAFDSEFFRIISNEKPRMFWAGLPPTRWKMRSYAATQTRVPVAALSHKSLRDTGFPAPFIVV